MPLALSRALRQISGGRFLHNVCCSRSTLTDKKPAKLESLGFGRLFKTVGTPVANDETGAATESSIPATSTIDTLLQENKSLRATLATLRWPILDAFVARGRNYPLPWHPPVNNSAALGDSDLQYLSGVFDGDGCAFARRSRASVTLCMMQSYDHPEVLLLFQDAFRGGIYGQKDGVGLTKPTLNWAVFGEQARLAAQELSTHSSTKRKQLELLAAWPEKPSERIDADLRLRSLKTFDSCTEFQCSWSYCAGFLDADGCIVFTPGGSSQVRFSQKFPTVLEHIRVFFAEQVGVKSRVYQFGARHFELRISRDADSKLVLQHMLGAGLRRKAPQALLVMSATPETAGHVRESFAVSVGNQKFGKRLDEAGVKRYVKINNLKTQQRYCLKVGQPEKAAALSQEIQMLKDEHEFLKAQLENQQLRRYTRMLPDLQMHGWQVPPDKKEIICQ